MTQRHVLSDNGWVDLRDPTEISERLRRPIKVRSTKLLANKAFADAMKKAQSEGITSADDLDSDEAAELAAGMADSMEALSEIQDLTVIAKVAAWAYGDAVSVDVLLDLPGKTYDEIQKLCAKGMFELMPDFSPSQDPASPTGPSTA